MKVNIDISLGMVILLINKYNFVPFMVTDDNNKPVAVFRLSKDKYHKVTDIFTSKDKIHFDYDTNKKNIVRITANDEIPIFVKNLTNLNNQVIKTDIPMKNRLTIIYGYGSNSDSLNRICIMSNNECLYLNSINSNKPIEISIDNGKIDWCFKKITDDETSVGFDIDDYDGIISMVKKDFWWEMVIGGYTYRYIQMDEISNRKFLYWVKINNRIESEIKNMVQGN